MNVDTTWALFYTCMSVQKHPKGSLVFVAVRTPLKVEINTLFLPVQSMRLLLGSHFPPSLLDALKSLSQAPLLTKLILLFFHFRA